MLTKLYCWSLKRAKTLTILPEEFLIHWANSKFVFSETKIATPPCLPKADDQKLFPRHLARKESIGAERAASVSCRKTKSEFDRFAKSKTVFDLVSPPNLEHSKERI